MDKIKTKHFLIYPLVHILKFPRFPSLLTSQLCLQHLSQLPKEKNNEKESKNRSSKKDGRASGHALKAVICFNALSAQVLPTPTSLLTFPLMSY